MFSASPRRRLPVHADLPDDPAGECADVASRIADWLPKARWFPGKGSGTGEIRVIDLVSLPGSGGLALGIVDCGRVRLVVPVDPRTGRDAAADREVAAAIVTLALGGGAVPGLHGRLVGRPVDARPAAAPRAAVQGSGAAGDLSVRPLGGDASNTSLLVESAGQPGAPSVLKLVRQARPGIHPEVEVGRFFAASTDWRGTPLVRGSVDYVPAVGAEASVVATLHAFEPGCRSAWEVLVESMTDGGLAGPHRAAIFDLVGRLGTVTARMHRALASRGDLPDFAPEPATAARRQALADRLAAHARDSLAAIDPERAPTRALTDRLARLKDRAPKIGARFEKLASAATTAADIRVHGDYHLGQVLVDAAGTRVMPIDFEGEPGRPLDERRAKTSAAKDVAGMLRSLDYLQRHVERIGGGGGGDPAPLAAAFLAAYSSAASGEVWWPADADEQRLLLAAFTLDKAVYELAYEIANRPDWIDVPLGALEVLIGSG
jgi:maltose alpha-D-glucosyltransferase/alpha-amylase